MAKKKLQPTQVQSLQKYKHASELASMTHKGLTFLQNIGWRSLIYHARNELDQERHRISLKELKELTGYVQHDDQYLVDALKKLNETVVVFNTLGKCKRVYNTKFTSLVSGGDYNRENGYFEYGFGFILRDVFKNSTSFSSLSICLSRRLNSSTALSLYGLVFDYKEINHTGDIPIEILRGIFGIGEKDYPAFADFNRNILKPACKKVNELTDVKIVAILQKHQRKVVSVKFNITRQECPVLVKPKPLANQIEDKKKREVSKNPYAHLGLVEAESELYRLNQGNHFPQEVQKRREFLKEHIKALGG